ncbi:helix-turn-helix transcriptional regulator [Halomonas heilongjiangensis]|uniref:LuxR family transcriptional regulator n=1 Tax=Halomonas heilongjiangensis TaxID=1387883 RepID=A0A2N7TNH3_9GAMM|nr:helix-turn-helix transcriptional regulator [Halomonas heilongjiangensis]PMR69730.1 LuxR family transcriptional regulator [Halomonas heilongjiangensis]PXX93060.1 helix-turn-helix transcriptional regulator [Halomonas heilongjiangensis]
MTAPRPPSDWPALMASVAACIEALGDPAFETHLLALLRDTARIEQCMIFAYDDEDGVDCLLAANERQPRIAGRLARLYTDGLFRQDPNYRGLRQASDDAPRVGLAPMRAEEMPPAYRGHLFAFPDLVDKVALTVREAEVAYTLNLYRGRDTGAFSTADLAGLDAMAPLLASLTRRHYATARPVSQQPSAEEAAVLAPLSERERQLCLFLLRGHTLKTAARELDVALSTAETYRKRAYAKLGVPSKARLVALCRRNA